MAASKEILDIFRDYWWSFFGLCCVQILSKVKAMPSDVKLLGFVVYIAAMLFSLAAFMKASSVANTCERFSASSSCTSFRRLSQFLVNLENGMKNGYVPGRY